MNGIDRSDFDGLWEFVDGMAHNYTWPDGYCFVSAMGGEVAILGKGCLTNVSGNPGARLGKDLHQAGFILSASPHPVSGGWLVNVMVPDVEPDTEMLAVVGAILRLNGFGVVSEQEARP